MKKLKTPWGEVEVPGLIPHHLECAQCGRCCRGFVLPTRETDRKNWYRWYLIDAPYQYPPDIGAVTHLFHVHPDRFTSDGEPLQTCKAFDPTTSQCMLMEDASDLRPIACWVFPYQYDFDDLCQGLDPRCSILVRTIAYLTDRYFKALIETYHPFSDLQSLLQ